jgi:hypothetical protein
MTYCTAVSIMTGLQLARITFYRKEEMCDEITFFNEQKNVCLFLGLHFLVDMKASDSIIDCNYV